MRSAIKQKSLNKQRGIIDRMAENRNLLVEAGFFLWERKAWWIAPIIFFLVIVGLLIIFAQSSAISPFIYALF